MALVWILVEAWHEPPVKLIISVEHQVDDALRANA